MFYLSSMHTMIGDKTTTMKGVLKRPLDSSKTCPVKIPKASSFQLLLRQLENCQIQQLRIGCHESCLTMGDYARLCKALRQNTSLKSVGIGWEIPRAALLKVLDSIARLPWLESLSLIIYTNLPKRLLRRLVSKSSLKHLELRNVAIGPSLWKENLILKATGKLILSSEANQNVSVLSSHFSDSIESLHVVSCELTKEDALRFCEWTQCRKNPLKELGFGFSTSLSPGCVETLCQRANCRRLDLTACGLDDNDAAVLAENIPKSRVIEDMAVGRNPLWGTLGDNTTSHPGFARFLQVAFQELKGLDISCCELSRAQAESVLQKLATDSECALQRLSMFGIPKKCDSDQALLKKILRNNTVLRSLHLRPATDLYRKPIPSKEDLACIEEVLKENYTLERLQVGNSTLLMDLYLGLNQAGRRYFREQPNVQVDWAEILSRASGRPDVMFWLLRHGTDRLFVGLDD